MTRLCAFFLAVALLPASGCAGKSPPTGATLASPKQVVTMAGAAAVVTPRVDPGDEVKLPDNFPVVGVVVEGRARAYSIAALTPLNGHVVNDLIGEVPVSVTYCSIYRCLRVYTHDQRGEPIPLVLTGHTNEGLLLRYQNRIYSQVAGAQPGGDWEEPPLQKLSFQQTTWKAWREQHPRTEVYTGSAGLAPPNNA